MSAIRHLRTVIRHPGILRPYRPLLLLSHMRANTSLLGHILGDNPEIDGYYELHIGYYSWRSLIRQKLRYFEAHAPKPGARYLFDKVLTNEHAVNPRVLTTGKLLFSLRPPGRTIASIVNLYRSEFPNHRYARPGPATEYYISRVRKLQELAARTDIPYLYFDADAVRSMTRDLLTALGDYLELREPLREDYQMRPMTGVRRTGDSSTRIASGTVQAPERDYPDVGLEEAGLAEAMAVFNGAREAIITHPLATHSVLAR